MKNIANQFIKLSMLVGILSAPILFNSCKAHRQYCFSSSEPQIRSICIVDRNGLSETISTPERLKQYAQVDFCSPQPYQKVLRIYHRDSNGNIKALVSSYYPNGQIKQYLEVINTRAYGTYKEWYSNGNCKVAAFIIGGEPDINVSAEKTWMFDGHACSWNEEGVLQADISYEKGELEGDSFYYHNNGTIWKKIPYHDGKIHGSFTTYLECGEILQCTEYCEGKKNGRAWRVWNPSQIASEEEYCHDALLYGRYYDACGTLVAEIIDGNGYKAIFGKTEPCELQEYRKGVQEGEIIVYGQCKKILRRYHVKNNQNHGEDTEYYEESAKSEQPRLLITWHEGKIQGIVKTWYDTGVQESNKEMSNNTKNGLSTAWYRDGSLMLLEEYDNDKLQKGVYYRRAEKRPISLIKDGKGVATIFDPDGNFVQKITYEKGVPSEELK